MTDEEKLVLKKELKKVVKKVADVKFYMSYQQMRNNTATICLAGVDGRSTEETLKSETEWVNSKTHASNYKYTNNKAQSQEEKEKEIAEYMEEWEARKKRNMEYMEESEKTFSTQEFKESITKLGVKSIEFEMKPDGNTTYKYLRFHY